MESGGDRLVPELPFSMSLRSSLRTLCVHETKHRT